VALCCLPIGQLATIQSISHTGALGRRLADMGVIPGQIVKVVRIAPLGDPIEIELLGYNLALRKSEAKGIEVLTKNT